jgi:hypothetical protein
MLLGGYLEHGSRMAGVLVQCAHIALHQAEPQAAGSKGECFSPGAQVRQAGHLEAAHAVAFPVVRAHEVPALDAQTPSRVFPLQLFESGELTEPVSVSVRIHFSPSASFT